MVLTGGTGLIMSNVAERHADMGDEVVLFDNNQQHDMYPETQTLLNEKKNVRFVKGDIRDAKAVAELAKGAEFYHFAALMGTSSRFKQEVITTEVNVIGTINACQAALDAGVKYYIYPPGRPCPSG